MRGKKSQLAIVLVLLFGAALIFYAAMFPELTNIIQESKNNMAVDNPLPEVLLIYDILPFAIGFMLFLGFVFSFARIMK